MSPDVLHAQVLAVLADRRRDSIQAPSRLRLWDGLTRIAQEHKPWNVTGKGMHCGVCMTHRGPQGHAVFLSAPCPTLTTLAKAIGLSP